MYSAGNLQELVFLGIIEGKTYQQHVNIYKADISANLLFIKNIFMIQVRDSLIYDFWTYGINLLFIPNFIEPNFIVNFLYYTTQRITSLSLYVYYMVTRYKKKINNATVPVSLS